MPLLGPENVDEIYAARADEVTSSRPVLTGDVFREIVIPGVGVDHTHAMVISHPCNMRAGPHLRERIQMIPIVSHDEVPLDGWLTGHVRYFMLPESGLSIGSCAARFDETGMVPSSDLTPERRAICLSERGILLLLHRLIYSQSRADIDLERLEKAVAHVLAEAELLEEWNEKLLPARRMTESDLVRALAIEAQKFDQFMEATANPSLREQLKDQHRRPSVRREARREMATRLEDQGSTPMIPPVT